MSSRHLRTTLYLSGGLGNQLFQIAFGMRLAGNTLRINTSQIRGDFELSSFVDYLAAKRAMEIELETSSPPRLFITLHNLILRSTQWSVPTPLKKFLVIVMMFILRLRKPRKESRFITDYTHIGDEELAEIQKGTFEIYIVGYFQKEMVACEIATDLINYLDSHVGTRHTSKFVPDSSMIVHVRRGDYAVEKKIGMLSFVYFKNAIEMASLKEKNLTVRYFSNSDLNPFELIDSSSVCEIDFVDFDRALDLLNSMRIGKFFVISNSTLSWWAAFLCDNDLKTVYYPNPWFRNLINPVNFFPSTWNSLPAIWAREEEK